MPVVSLSFLCSLASRLNWCVRRSAYLAARSCSRSLRCWTRNVLVLYFGFPASSPRFRTWRWMEPQKDGDVMRDRSGLKLILSEWVVNVANHDKVRQVRWSSLLCTLWRTADRSQQPPRCSRLWFWSSAPMNGKKKVKTCIQIKPDQEL